VLGAEKKNQGRGIVTDQKTVAMASHCEYEVGIKDSAKGRPRQISDDRFLSGEKTRKNRRIIKSPAEPGRIEVEKEKKIWLTATAKHASCRLDPVFWRKN